MSDQEWKTEEGEVKNWTMPINRAFEMRACNCIGPQNGNPVCPCMMGDYNRRKSGEMALEILMHMTHKPRVRVKAGSRVV